MGLFKRKNKDDYRDKLARIERSVWELENKQILYLDKLKTVVTKQEEYKKQGKLASDKNMQRHYAGLYINCEHEKEQIAASINELSKEIISAGRMAQLVDTQALTLELEKTESLTLDEISRMSETISKSRLKREAESSLKNEAIDRALRVEDTGINEDVDRVLGLWEEEKSAEDEMRAFTKEQAPEKTREPEPAPERAYEPPAPDEIEEETFPSGNSRVNE